jgi:hypothetical protein
MDVRQPCARGRSPILPMGTVAPSVPLPSNAQEIIDLAQPPTQLIPAPSYLQS